MGRQKDFSFSDEGTKPGMNFIVERSFNHSFTLALLQNVFNSQSYADVHFTPWLAKAEEMWTALGGKSRTTVQNYFKPVYHSFYAHSYREILFVFVCVCACAQFHCACAAGYRTTPAEDPEYIFG